MSWSYRVVKTVTKIPLGDTDISYGIHEVYYDSNWDIINISEGLAHPISDDLEGLQWNLERMIEACKKPVIDYNTGEELNQQSPTGWSPLGNVLDLCFPYLGFQRQIMGAFLIQKERLWTILIGNLS